MAKAVIINQLIDVLGIKLTPFEAEIGVSNGTLKGAIKRDGDLTLNVIEKIIAKYPQVNREYLLTGEGAILKSEDEWQDVSLSEADVKYHSGKKWDGRVASLQSYLDGLQDEIEKLKNKN